MRPSTSKRSRPAVLRIIIALLLFLGIDALLAAFLRAGVDIPLGYLGVAGPDMLALASGVPLSLLSFLNFAVAFGLVRRKRWALRVFIFSSALDVGLLLILESEGSLAALPGLGVNVLLAFVLSGQNVRADFGVRSQPPSDAYVSLPIMLLLTMSSFTPALIITPVSPASSPGGGYPSVQAFRLLRVGFLDMAFRFAAIVPVLRLEPQVVITDPYSSNANQATSSAGEGAGPGPRVNAVPPSSACTAGLLPSTMQPSSDPAQPICNDSQYQGTTSQLRVYVSSPAVNQPYGCIQLGTWANPIAYDQNNGYIYALSHAFGYNNGNANVSIEAIGDLSGSVVANITLPARAQAELNFLPQMLFDPSNNLLYATGSNETYFINAETMRYQGSVWIGHGGNYPAMALDTQNGNLYITDDQTGTLLAINTATNTLVANITLPTYGISDVAYDSSSNRLFVVSGASALFGQNVTVVDPTAEKAVSNITLPAGAEYGIVYDPANRLLYMDEATGGFPPLTLMAINGTSDSYVSNVTLSTTVGEVYGAQLIFDPGNNEIYDAQPWNAYGNATFAYNPSTGSVQQIGVCDGSWPFAGDTDCGPAFVTYDSWNGVMYFAKSSGEIIAVPTDATKLPRSLVFLAINQHTAGASTDEPLSLTPPTAWNVTVSVQDRSWTNSTSSASLRFEVPSGYNYGYVAPEIVTRARCAFEGCNYNSNSPSRYLPVPVGSQAYTQSSGVYQIGQAVSLSGTVFLASGGCPSAKLFNENVCASIYFSPLWSERFSPPPPSHGTLSVTVEECSTAPAAGGERQACAPSTAIKQSSTGWITFLEPFGVYSYSVRAPGYAVTPAEGTMTVTYTGQVVALSYDLLSVGQEVLSAYGAVFEARPQEDEIDVYPAAGSTFYRIGVGSYPISVANATVGAYDLIFVVNQGSDNVTVLDASTLAVIGSIAVGDTPVGISTERTGASTALVYVTDFYSNEVSVISVSSDSVANFGSLSVSVSSIHTFDSPTGVATCFTCGTVYVSMYNHASVGVYLIGGIPDGNITVGERPMGMVFDPVNGYLFIANSNSSSVSLVYPSYNNEGAFNVPPYPDMSSCDNPVRTFCPVVGVEEGPVGLSITSPVNVDPYSVSLFVSYNDSSDVNVINEGLAIAPRGVPTGAPTAKIPTGHLVGGVASYNSTAGLASWPANAGSPFLVIPTYPVTLSLTSCAHISIAFVGSGISACNLPGIGVAVNQTQISLGSAGIDLYNETFSLPAASYSLAFAPPSGWELNDNGCNTLYQARCITSTGGLILNEVGSVQGPYLLTMSGSPCTAPASFYTSQEGVSNQKFVSTCLVRIGMVPQPEPLWMNDPNFAISQSTVSPQALGGIVTAVSGGALAPSAFGLEFANPSTDSVVITSIAPAAGTSAKGFNSSIYNDLGIGAPSGYSAVSATLLYVPFHNVINDLLWFLGGPVPASVGSFTLVFITSQNAKGQSGLGSDLSSVDSKIFSTLITGLGSTLLCVLKGQGCNSAPSGSTIASYSNSGAGQETLWYAVLKSITDNVGDVTMGFISNVDASGQLVAATLLDFVLILKDAALFNAIVSVITSVVSWILDVVKIVKSAASFTWVQLVGEVIKFLADTFNLVINVVDLVECVPQLNPDYSQMKETCSQLGDMKSIGTAISAFGGLISADPNGVSVVPSYYAANGTLVLGYSPTTGTFVYNSSAGYVLAGDGFYYAYLTKEQNLTLSLSAIGANQATVPYTVTVSPWGPSFDRAGVSGEIQTGTSASIPVDRLKNGTLVHPVVLSPRLTVSGEAGKYTVLLAPYLSNGTRVAATGAELTLNNTVYQMSMVNSTLFSLDLSYSSAASAPFTAEAQALGFPGGYANGTLPGASSSTTATITTSTTSSTTSSTASTTASGTTGGGGGIPEFPYQLIAVTILMAVLVVSYLVIRVRGGDRGSERSSE